MSNYFVPEAAVELELEVKKSRFIARADRVQDRDAAMAMLAQARADYPDARHHCWAYRLGGGSQTRSAAMSDDGEPSGTAGKPILNVLQHKDIGDIMIVVIRYFGGVKLGAGGLVRAYSNSAQMAVDGLNLIQHRSCAEFVLTCDFPGERDIRHWLAGCEGEIIRVDYGEQVQLHVSLGEEYAAGLADFCSSRGFVCAVVAQEVIPP